MARSFAFRLTAEGVDELRKQLEDLGTGGQRAFDTLRNAAPRLADAMAVAERAVDQARGRIEQAGRQPFRGVVDGLGTLESRANSVRGGLRDFRGAVELLAPAADSAAGRLAGLAQVADNIGDTFSAAAITLSNVFAGPLGRLGAVIATFARANPILFGLTTAATAAAAAFGVYAAAGGSAEQATLSYAEAVRRLNERLLDQAEIQRRAQIQTLDAERGALAGELRRREQAEARARESLATAEANAARLGDPRAAAAASRAREDIGRFSGAVEEARRNLALIDGQIERTARGFEQIGRGAAAAGAGLESLSAIRARLATPRERIDAQFQSTMAALAARREAGDLTSDDYWNLVRRTQNEQGRALTDLNKPAGGGGTGRDAAGELARARIGFGRQAADLAGQERALEFEAQAMQLRARGTREAQEALADLTAARDRDARAAERAQRIDELNARAREAERLGLGEVAQAYRDQAEAVGESYDRIERAAALRNRVARDQIAMAESLKAGAAIGRDVGGALSNLFDDIAFKSRNAADAVRDFGMALARAFLQRGLVDPVSSWASNWFGNLFSGGGATAAPAFLPQIASARGNLFERGRVVPFARGGIVDRPTLFPMADGAGLMGEAGPEAVMPLARDRSGRLGVRAQGGGASITVPVSVTINGNVSSAEHARTLGAETARAIRQTIVEVVRNEMRPGGALRGEFA